jgi:hypothetical protein
MTTTKTTSGASQRDRNRITTRLSVAIVSYGQFNQTAEFSRNSTNSATACTYIHTVQHNIANNLAAGTCSQSSSLAINCTCAANRDCLASGKERSRARSGECVCFNGSFLIFSLSTSTTRNTKCSHGVAARRRAGWTPTTEAGMKF